MTDEEARVRGRCVARARGWAWREPARVLRYRRGLAGRAVVVVITEANRQGQSARVEIDAATGRVLVADFEAR